MSSFSGVFSNVSAEAVWNYQEVCRGAVDAKQDISLLWPYIILIALGVYTCALCIVECGCYKFIHEMNVVI